MLMSLNEDDDNHIYFFTCPTGRGIAVSPKGKDVTLQCIGKRCAAFRCLPNHKGGAPTAGYCGLGGMPQS